MRFGGLTALLALVAASAALAAPGAGARGSASAVHATTQRLDSRVHEALLSLYALDSQLQTWRARLGSLESQAAALRARRASLESELGADRTSLKTSQHQLALELRVAYQQGNVNPVAVVLGAQSLSKGLSQLDDLSRVASQSGQIVAATSAANVRLLRSQRRLAAEERRLDRSLAAARQAEARKIGRAHVSPVTSASRMPSSA